PRLRLARMASRRLGQELIRRWTATDATAVRSDVASYLEEQWDLRGLSPEQLAEKVHQKLTAQIGVSPADQIEAIIAAVTDGLRNEKAESKDYYGAVDQLVRLLGATPGYLADSPVGRVPALFEQLGPELSAMADQQVADLAIQAVERPGLRITGTEELIRQLG